MYIYIYNSNNNKPIELFDKTVFESNWPKVKRLKLIFLHKFLALNDSFFQKKKI